MDFDAVFSALPKKEAKFDPCFAFSIHKCGSTMMNRMIGEVCEQQDIPSVSVPDVMFSEGIPAAQWMNAPELLPVFEKRMLYYGFRFLPPVLCTTGFPLTERRFVLLVRDPRDALVSEYFSYGTKSGSHALPKKNAEAFIAARESKKERPIDDYVLGASRQLKNKLLAYRDSLNFDLGLLRRYEDIFFDKETFLGEIFDHFGIEVPAGVIAQVAQKHDIRPEKEDETRHIRKGTPGDHAEKLAPETIAQLNDIFREVGAFYGYAL
ncbi:sulfotransferase domain-containing protein [Actibacterium sp. MT2.3-13A]|uniref:sulfotransferase domain-containing protein n=1 Tax=Actibacterium sp. MT2.3-13A TaxID=2828332 RepID=UPI001BA69C29|nr:sulfotransferase domain-containing protein [Actibacterium sp. MT2.3-13A]